jgi:pseudouridylate synthase I
MIKPLTKYEWTMEVFMRNIKLTIEYDGSRYSGWQRLGKDETNNTIETKITEVLNKMVGHEVELNCGCRTENGVHAYEQVANFKENIALKPYEIKNYLNRFLPMDIAILNVEDMPERFHASLNAKSKTYVYRIATGAVPSVFTRKYTYYSFDELDIPAMKKAAKYLIGKHDFKYFSTVKKSKSTEKEIYSIDFIKSNDELRIEICANDFLHNMTRMIIATLMDIGLHKEEADVILDIFNTKSPVITTSIAEAKGLFLQKINY